MATAAELRSKIWNARDDFRASIVWKKYAAAGASGSTV
jgi:hypothetical protein